MGATPEEKKKRLHEDFDIAMTEEFESEVRDCLLYTSDAADDR